MYKAWMETAGILARVAAAGAACGVDAAGLVRAMYERADDVARFVRVGLVPERGVISAWVAVSDVDGRRDRDVVLRELVARNSSNARSLLLRGWHWCSGAMTSSLVAFGTQSADADIARLEDALALEAAQRDRVISIADRFGKKTVGVTIERGADETVVKAGVFVEVAHSNPDNLARLDKVCGQLGIADAKRSLLQNLYPSLAAKQPALLRVDLHADGSETLTPLFVKVPLDRVARIAHGLAPTYSRAIAAFTGAFDAEDSALFGLRFATHDEPAFEVAIDVVAGEAKTLR